MVVSTGTFDGLYFTYQGDGDPLLLIHGFGASSDTWSELIEPLSKRFKVVTIDLRGFGKSDKSVNASYTLEAQAKNVQNVISYLKLNDVTLIGHSMGGGITLLVALQMTSARLRRLVLIDSIACPQSLPLFIALLQTPILGPLLVRLVPPSWSVRYVLHQSYHDPRLINPDRVQAYADALSSSGGRDALVATARELIPKKVSNFIKLYDTIQVPVLLLWGQEDRIVPLCARACLKAAFPAAHTPEIRDCGHLPHEEQPHEALKELLEFLKPTKHASRLTTELDAV